MDAASPPTERSVRLQLVLLLVASYALRVGLAFGGGQAFWPDEARYASSRAAVYEMAHGQIKTALSELLGHADHVLFRWAGLPAAAVEYFLHIKTPAFAACYFGLFSVGVVFLVWAVARRSGGSERESLWAAFFAASANSLFYFSRHYFPYDVALFGLLLSLWFGLGPWSAGNSLLTGIVAGLGFLTYNGYWLLAACVLSLHAVLGSGGRHRAWARAAYGFTGTALAVGLVVGTGMAASGGMLSSYRMFAGSVRQGDFGIGYRVIPEYLWSSEHALLLVWLLAFAYAFASPVGPSGRGRLRWWTGGVLVVFAGLVLVSDIVPIFVVYGRLARQVVPFLCLGAGLGTARFLETRKNSGGWWSAGVFLLVVGLAAVNFSFPLRQVFPEDFLKLAEPAIRRSSGLGYGFLRVLNAGQLWGTSLSGGGPSTGEILRRSNPLLFRPYQFEGYTAAQRLKLNREDLAMRLVKVPMARPEPAAWEGYPGPVRVVVTFPKNRWGLAEPLFSAGKNGAGDVLFVRYLDPGHVEFGLDHWGAGAIVSRAVEVDYGRPHEILVFAGSLLPPSASAAMNGHLLVIFDGNVVLSRHAAFYTPSKADIYFGYNMIGATSAEPYFTGAVSGFSAAPVSSFEGSLPTLAASAMARGRPAAWRGALGPQRMRLVLPPLKAHGNEGQPLVSIGGSLDSGVLYVVRDGPDRVRIGMDTLGAQSILSEPLRVSPSGLEEVELSFGSMLPEADSGVYGRAPHFAQMRNTVYVRFNGEMAIFATQRFGTVTPDHVVFGMNAAKSSACTEFFQGEITSVAPIDLEEIAAGATAVPGPLSHLARPGWDGYPGPIRIEVSFSAGTPGESQPILTTGITGAGDMLFIRYDAGGMARICLDHWGAPLTASEPFAVMAGERHNLVVSIGGLFPPAGSSLYLGDPRLAVDRGRVRVDLDGRRILSADRSSYPSRPEWITIGANFLGGSSVGTPFQGQLGKVTQAPVPTAAP
jgi:hypothetical protein